MLLRQTAMGRQGKPTPIRSNIDQCPAAKRWQRRLVLDPSGDALKQRAAICGSQRKRREFPRLFY